MISFFKSNSTSREKFLCFFRKHRELFEAAENIKYINTYNTINTFSSNVFFCFIYFFMSSIFTMILLMQKINVFIRDTSIYDYEIILLMNIRGQSKITTLRGITDDRKRFVMVRIKCIYSYVQRHWSDVIM